MKHKKRLCDCCTFQPPFDLHFRSLIHAAALMGGGFLVADSGIPCGPSFFITSAFFRVSWDTPAILASSSRVFKLGADFFTMFKSFRDPCLSFAFASTFGFNFNASSARWNALPIHFGHPKKALHPFREIFWREGLSTVYISCLKHYEAGGIRDMGGPKTMGFDTNTE